LQEVSKLKCSGHPLIYLPSHPIFQHISVEFV
jgi:hypothetical protein